MADPALSPTLARMLREINRRLSAVERSASLPWTSLRGGAMRFQDDTGNDRLVMGNFGLDEVTGDPDFVATGPTSEVPPEFVPGGQASYGVLAQGDANTVGLWLREGIRGRVYPNSHFAMVRRLVGDPSEFVAFRTQSTFFVEPFGAVIVQPDMDTVFIDHAVVCSVNTAAEVRLRDVGNAIATDPVAVPLGGNGRIRWMWKHPARIGLYDDTPTSGFLVLRLEVRVTAGGGSVDLYPPAVTALVSSALHPSDPAGGGQFY